MSEADTSLPDFNGKIVIFYIVNSDPRYPMILESPTFEHYDGRLFVVGPQVSAQNWTDGLRTAIAWDQLQYFIAFGSKAEYEERWGVDPKGKKRGLFASARA